MLSKGVIAPRRRRPQVSAAPSAGSPRRRYTEPNRASMRNQAGRIRTRTISSAPTASGRLRQETHCGQSEHAAHRHADAASPELTRTTSWSSNDAGGPCALLCSFASCAPRCARSSTAARRHVVDVGESGFRRQRAAPRRVHREPGVDVAGAVHRRQPARQFVCADGQVAGPHGTGDHPAGQHVETGCHPGVTSPPDRARSRMTAASSSRIARSTNVGQISRWAASASHSPRSAHRSHRCRYSR